MTKLMRDGGQLLIKSFGRALVLSVGHEDLCNRLGKNFNAFVMRFEGGKKVETNQHPYLVRVRQSGYLTTVIQVIASLLDYSLESGLGRCCKAGYSEPIHLQLRAATLFASTRKLLWRVDSDPLNLASSTTFCIPQPIQHFCPKFPPDFAIQGLLVSLTCWRRFKEGFGDRTKPSLLQRADDNRETLSFLESWIDSDVKLVFAGQLGVPI